MAVRTPTQGSHAVRHMVAGLLADVTKSPARGSDSVQSGGTDGVVVIGIHHNEVKQSAALMTACFSVAAAHHRLRERSAQELMPASTGREPPLNQKICEDRKPPPRAS